MRLMLSSAAFFLAPSQSAAIESAPDAKGVIDVLKAVHRHLHFAAA